MNNHPIPLVVQYLYVHQQGEDFYYPTVRSDSSIAQVANRYLECALTQSASLALRDDVSCELALATNVSDRRILGPTGIKLMERIEALGVQILPTEYRHRPGDDSKTYLSSRYVLDAILKAIEGQPEDRQIWFTDLDCVWVHAERLFAAAPPAPAVGCIHIPYPPDWDTVGFGIGVSRNAIGELAKEMGASPTESPSWVGGELIGGTPATLRKLVATCEELDSRLARQGQVLATEEQILTLAGALGAASFHDLSDLARRVTTGTRTEATRVQEPLSLGLWHLPSEKGLSLRRAARQVCSGRTARLRRDFADPQRAARRFNVQGNGLGRRVRDDGWIAWQRLRGVLKRLDRRR